MASRPIIKHLNILEKCCSWGFTSFKDVASYFLLLEALEEGFNHRIIITVPSTLHAWNHALGLTGPISIIAGKLNHLIRVNHDVILGLPSPHSHQ